MGGKVWKGMNEKIKLYGQIQLKNLFLNSDRLSSMKPEVCPE